MTHDYHQLPDIAPRANVVPWYGKTWHDIKAHYMPALEQHLIDLTAAKGKERAADYLKYLQTMSGAKGYKA